MAVQWEWRLFFLNIEILIKELKIGFDDRIGFVFEKIHVVSWKQPWFQDDIFNPTINNNKKFYDKNTDMFSTMTMK